MDQAAYLSRVLRPKGGSVSRTPPIMLCVACDALPTPTRTHTQVRSRAHTRPLARPFARTHACTHTRAHEAQPRVDTVQFTHHHKMRTSSLVQTCTCGDARVI